MKTNTPSDTQHYTFDRSGESITVNAHSLREAIFKAATELTDRTQQNDNTRTNAQVARQ